MILSRLIVFDCSWFHYKATFEDSERRLRDYKVNGAFLVREQPDNKFRLVFRAAGAVSNNKYNYSFNILDTYVI